MARTERQESERVRRARRNRRALLIWTAVVCSGIPMIFWYLQTRAMAASSHDGPVDASQWWKPALACWVTTAVAWFVGRHLLLQYLDSRDRTRALMADLRGVERRDA
ncbi:hypothetical protein [Intrasporangium mesophilum]